MRPLLGLHKWQLEEACREASLKWAVDPTNTDTSFLRNHTRALLAQVPAAWHVSQPTSATAQEEIRLTGTEHSDLSTAAAPDGKQHHTTQLTAAAELLQSNVSARGQREAEHLQAQGSDSLRESSGAQPAQPQSQAMPSEASHTSAAGDQEPQPSIAEAIFRVQQRCAAVHDTVSAEAKGLLQASLHHQLVGTGSAGAHLVVQPFARANTAVALHALSAALQACLTSLSSCWHCFTCH